MQNIVDQKEKYDKINEEIKKLQPDFSSLVNFVDGKILDKLIKLIDEILGEKLASYFLECQSMKGGGKITIDNREVFSIRNIKDLEFYLENRRKS